MEKAPGAGAAGQPVKPLDPSQNPVAIRAGVAKLCFEFPQQPRARLEELLRKVGAPPIASSAVRRVANRRRRIKAIRPESSRCCEPSKAVGPRTPVAALATKPTTLRARWQPPRRQ